MTVAVYATAVSIHRSPRELAYRNYERLRDAGTDAEWAQVAAEIEGYSAAVAAVLRQAFSYPPGTDSSERDAYCKVNSAQSIK